MKALLPFALLLLLMGCASSRSPRAEAIDHVQPVVVALQAYQQATGNYPQQLNELQPAYLPADVPLEDYRDPAHHWVVIYQRTDQSHYQLYVDSSPCSQAVFKDGRFLAGYGPNFR